MLEFLNTKRKKEASVSGTRSLSVQELGFGVLGFAQKKQGGWGGVNARRKKR